MGRKLASLNWMMCGCRSMLWFPISLSTHLTSIFFPRLMHKHQLRPIDHASAATSVEYQTENLQAPDAYLFASGDISGELHKAIATLVEVCYLDVSAIVAQRVNAGQWSMLHDPLVRPPSSVLQLKACR